MKRTLSILAVISLANMAYTYLAVQGANKRMDALERILSEGRGVKVTATMYNPVEGQCDQDPLITAGMYKIDPSRASHHRWIAVSRDLLKRWGGRFEYGDKVKIRGAGHKDGIYTIVDTMNKRFTNRIDFLETKGTKWYRYDNVQLASI